MQNHKRLRSAVLATAGALAIVVGFGVASADSIGPITFEPPTYAPGSPNGQDGWVATGSAGSGCAPYDHQIVTNSGAPASFGTQSLRMSNAVTSGCFGDQTFSKPVADEAGETTAANGGMSGGTRQSRFEAQWQFASTVPAAEQVGLSVVASPDRGDGARMSWVQMADTPSGLAVSFYEYRDNAPYGSTGNLAAGCGVEDDFQLVNVATGLDRTAPHTIRVTMDFLDGPRNDVVRVYVDGVLSVTGTSWEDYFRYCEATDTSRTVDSILFRTGGVPAPATMGNGFLIDGLSITTSSATDGRAQDVCKDGGWQTFTGAPGPFTNQGQCVSHFTNQ